MDGFDSIWDDFVKEAWKAQGKGQKVSRDIHLKTANKLADAVMKGGLKQDYAYDDPKNLLAAKIKSNLFAFSAAKTLTQYQAMAESVANAGSFNKFRLDVEKINPLYNEVWLRTEYDTCIASGQAAVDWSDILENADVAAYLQYLTMGDDKVREDHAVLNLLIAKVVDAIWNTIFPPNGWNCRCRTKQLTSGRGITDPKELVSRVKAANIQPMFKTNVGKTGVVVNKDHPYFQTVKGKLTELDAVKNYGMRDWTGIHNHMRDYAPPLPAAKTKEGYSAWWDAMAKQHPAKDEGFAIPDKMGNTILFDAGNKANHFREHVADRHAYAWLADKVIQTPDEAWSFYDIRNPNKKLTHTYLKYYQDKILTVVVTESEGILKAETIYSVENEKTFNNLRKGVLLHANKKF